MRRKDDEKERCIREAVIKIILQEGLNGASISKIAKLAGVSPATVYIYYENKENMLQDIYCEYSEKIYDYLLGRIYIGMGGHQVIEMLVKSYYNFIIEHREIFSFVEQVSNCPSLSGGYPRQKNICNLYNLFSEMKKSRMVRNYNDDTLLAVIFHPVKAIASDDKKSEGEREDMLQEMIKIIQDAILI
jgi:AcrR family transcriptional regulator